MKFIRTEIPEVQIIEPDIYRDQRGFFLENWNIEKYSKAGITDAFKQDSHSLSQKGTVRGLHAQLTMAQAKLIRVIEGEIFDVAVDIREGSPTFGKWVGAVLSEENFRQLYIPVGFAHGFAVTSERAQVQYKQSEVYHPEDEIGILWNDPEIGVDWPVSEPILSERDKRHKTLAEMAGSLPTYKG